jgi:hypothetical protein
MAIDVILAKRATITLARLRERAGERGADMANFVKKGVGCHVR